MINIVVKLTCDSNSFQCSQTSYFDSLEIAKYYGWIINTPHCICPSCVIKSIYGEDVNNG